jgi:hypothetical protein
LIARGTELARGAKQLLGTQLGRVILEPLDEGTCMGLSYVVVPYCRPLSSGRLADFFHRIFLGSEVFAWLRAATRATVASASKDRIERDFLRPLRYLAELDMVSDRIRAAADQAAERLITGKWIPKHVLMHNDLWKGNVLIRTDENGDTPDTHKWWKRFVIIDWLGARLKGYAMYDLVRFARSIKARRSRLTEEVRWHCRELECDLIDARSHLLTSLGHLGMHLEYFPPEVYREQASRCFQTLQTTVG